MSRYVHVEFLPKSQHLYTYECGFEVKEGDLVAVPPNWVSTEGAVAVVREIKNTPFGYKGEVKSVTRVISRSQWRMFGYDPGD